MASLSSQYATPDSPVEPARTRDRGDDQRVLDDLLAGGRPVLIRGGTVLSQDPAVGDLARGDVLIRDGKIAEVGPDLQASAGDAVVVDASDSVVLPGFVDAHVHAWEGQLRGLAPTLDFNSYLGFTAFGAGPQYRPHDNYVGTLLTALVALDSGITTIIDNSHNSHTPEHSNAAVEALRDSGIRGVHASGAPVSGEVEHWPTDVTRLRDEYFSSDDQLLTLRLFDLYPSPELWAFARHEGLWVSHEMGAHIPDLDDVMADFAAKGLLTEKHTFNHCFALSDKVWGLIRDAGATVNLAPRSDAAFGLGTGFPPVDQALAVGLRPALSGDNEVSYGLSMFTEMQTLLNKHRGSVFEKILMGDENPPEHLTPGDLLEFATLRGAENAGLGDRTGSLSPGKAADVVLVRTRDLNTAPGSNARATVTAFAETANVDTVLVGGQVRKFRGELVGVDVAHVLGLAEASRDRILAAQGLRPDVLAEQGSAPQS